MNTEKEIVDFMKKHHKKHFKFPTYQEIMENVGFQSKSSVHLRMRRLESSGQVEFYGNGYKLNDQLMIELFEEIVR